MILKTAVDRFFVLQRHESIKGCGLDTTHPQGEPATGPLCGPSAHPSLRSRDPHCVLSCALRAGAAQAGVWLCVCDETSPVVCLVGATKVATPWPSARVVLNTACPLNQITGLVLSATKLARSFGQSTGLVYAPACRGGAPQRRPRGPAQAGIGQRRGCRRPRVGHQHPATGSHPQEGPLLRPSRSPYGVVVSSQTPA